MIDAEWYSKRHPKYRLYMANGDGEVFMRKPGGILYKKPQRDDGRGYLCLDISLGLCRETVKAHRFIWECFNGPIPKGMHVDHIDHNTLNDRGSNLRPCTFAQNCRNIRSTGKKTSKYKGDHWNKRNKKWAAQITCDNRSHHLGYFSNQTSAAKAYDRAAKKYHQDFAFLNFPQDQ